MPPSQAAAPDPAATSVGHPPRLRCLAPDDELIAEERWPGAHGKPVGRAHPTPCHTVAGGEHLDGQPRGLLAGDRESGTPDQIQEAPPSEEADVAAIEDAPLVVVEEADRCPHPGVPMPEVGNRDDQRAPRDQHGADLLEQALRISDVLEDIGCHRQVEGWIRLEVGREPAVEVGLQEAVHPLGDSRQREHVDAGDVVAECPDALGEQTAGAADVEDAAGGHLPEPAQDDRVRAVLSVLEAVLVADPAQVSGEVALAGETESQHVERGVTDPAQGVGGVSLLLLHAWYWHLGDAFPSAEELEDDLEVEVIVAGVALEGDRAECLDPVGAPTGVEIRELRAQLSIDLGKKAAADPFPDRSTGGVVPRRHPRPDDGVELVPLEGGHQRLDEAGRVRSRAAEHDDDVEIALDRQPVRRLLEVARAAAPGQVDDPRRATGRHRRTLRQTGGGAVPALAEEDRDKPCAQSLGHGVQNRGRIARGIPRDHEDADPCLAGAAVRPAGVPVEGGGVGHEEAEDTALAEGCQSDPADTLPQAMTVPRAPSVRGGRRPAEPPPVPASPPAGDGPLPTDAAASHPHGPAQGHFTVITLPAYKAEKTLERTIGTLPPGAGDHLLLVDDASPDGTVALARGLGIDVRVHDVNRGYGANQKTCYREALELGATVIVLLHPDYQYDPSAVPALIAPIVAGVADFTFGSRFACTGNPRAGGMPFYRYWGNRFSTVVENFLLGAHFTEMHSGMKAYGRRFLESVPYESYSDDFIFDTEILVAAVMGGFRIQEVAIPTRYTKESSSINVRRSLEYVGRSIEVCWRSSGTRRRQRRREGATRPD